MVSTKFTNFITKFLMEWTEIDFKINIHFLLEQHWTIIDIAVNVCEINNIHVSSYCLLFVDVMKHFTQILFNNDATYTLRLYDTISVQ